MIIMDDIPIKQAVDGIMIGAFLNSGQVCIAASRIYLHENIYEEVKTKLSKVIKNLVIGGLMKKHKSPLWSLPSSKQALKRISQKLKQKAQPS